MSKVIEKYIPDSAEWMRDVWIPALRSGDYSQGVSWLHRDYGEYCCLGVLCELRGAEWHEAEDHFIAVFPEEKRKVYLKGSCETILPDWLIGDLGIGSEGEFVRSIYDEERQKYYASLVEMNDEGATFEEIADVIEQCLDPNEKEYGFQNPVGNYFGFQKEDDDE